MWATVILLTKYNLEKENSVSNHDSNNQGKTTFVTQDNVSNNSKSSLKKFSTNVQRQM